MLEDYEKIFEVVLPEDHELSARVPGLPKPNEDVFRTKVAVQLKEQFGTDLFTLRETHFNRELSYRMSITLPRVEEFRKKIADLGLQLREPINGNSKR